MDVKFLKSKITSREVKFIYEIIRWYGDYSIENLSQMLVGKTHTQMFDILRKYQAEQKIMNPDDFYGEARGKSKAKKLWYTLKPVLKKHKIRINSFMDFGGTNCHTAYYMGQFMRINPSKTYCVDLDGWAGMDWKRRGDVNFVSTKKISTIPNNSVRCIHTSHTLHHATDAEIKKYIEQFYRIIPPRGILVLYEHDSNSKWMFNMLDITHALFDVVLAQTSTFEEFNKGWVSNYKPKKKWDVLLRGKFRQIYFNRVPHSANNNYYCIYASTK